MRAILGLGCLAVLAACASDPAPSAVAPAKPAAVAVGSKPVAVAAADKKVCRSMPVTGSLAPKRVCSTQAEWTAFDKNAKENSDRFDEQRRSGGEARQ
jgi:hypothetical protein